MERSTVQFGSKRIDYSIRRSPRRTTVAVAVDPVEGILVTAPRGTAVSRIDTVVYKKARWILDRLRAVSDSNGHQSRREFVSGETCLYLDRQYRLKVLQRKEPEPTRLVRGWLTVQVPRGLDEVAPEVRTRLIDWYKTHATERLRERIAIWAPKVGVPEPHFLIREPKQRWGSCDSRGNLRFNWRIIQAPMQLVDYVVVHELHHIIERDHTEQFWANVGHTLPDYELRRTELRELGSLLLW